MKNKDILKIVVACLVSVGSSTSLFAAESGQCGQSSRFNVGAGIYDITGPAAEEGMLGYGLINQKTAGIYQRLWARAFVIESPCNQKRVVVVNTDLGMMFQSVKQGVMKKLTAEYGDKYSDSNVLLAATHTHSGPGGYASYVFYNITTLGFNRFYYGAIVDGIVNAIERADDNLAPATIKIATGTLNALNHNRSPQAYALNPGSERAKYNNDTDTNMTLMRFERLDGTPIGMINWFPIHGVSLSNKNHLISSDNKGYAEYLFEKDFQSDYGPHAFVAAFAQANAGDVSSNPYGHEGKAGLEGLQLVEQAGRPQYEKAKELFNHATEIVSGAVDYRHEYVKMDAVTIDPRYTDGEQHTTCPAAIGVSMLAGTQDGEGYGWQGITCDEVSSVLGGAMCEMTTTSCQGAKPIAIETGTKTPHPWTANILPLQEFKIGNVVIVAAPFELDTMTGRRIRETVSAQLPAKMHVMIASYANAYAGYVVTPEEYPLQRYEAASTHFGPWQSSALQQEFAKLTKALVSHSPVPAGPQPEDLVEGQVDMQPGVLYDSAPFGYDFGDIEHDVAKSYHAGEEVRASFWGGHPKNNFHQQGTYLEVQRLENNQWVTVRRDRDWDTEYHWARAGISESRITIVWRLPKEVTPGKYRIVHEGDWKSRWSGHITPYVGYSSVFTIV